ncbi:hypothetical protein P3G55_17780 [Leptospira sp. 96542]|nr:hypothetical protein [Leptospira sp. 96542]
MKRIFLQILFIGFISLFGNCYFNPFVQGIVNPVEEKDDTASAMALGIVGAAGAFSSGSQVVVATGQILDYMGMPAISHTVTVTSRSFELDNLPLSTTTDTGGRFYIMTTVGSTELSVSQFLGGPEVLRFRLEIETNSINVADLVSEADYTISGLEVQNPENSILYFDLMSSYPNHGSMVPFVPESLNLTFSENLPASLLDLPPNEQLFWASGNISISPTIIIDSVYFNSEQGAPPKDVSIYWDTESFQPDVEYTITLSPGIRSETGKVLKTTTIKFTYSPES